ncbi:uncharacterized protein LOC117176828 [Belonocnema kinseyi]|uniref:uncharacterized protein LOC117176828 n=1 Tax=Belonocnema kinseyi TaxID=2817044 RepID=UPI00143DFAEC|nr:uncharacterized protein LOC117176828 [Belonocnema kinseyi]
MALKVGFWVLLLVTLAHSRSYREGSKNEDISRNETKSPLEIISYREEKVPTLYLVLFGNTMTELDIPEKEKAILDTRYERKREKRNANEDDLETAAGTNVLRPLFVYRQQLAYRERLRKSNRRVFRF